MMLRKFFLTFLFFSIFSCWTIKLSAQDDVPSAPAPVEHKIIESSIISKAEGPVLAVSWAPDSSSFATGGNKFSILWNAENNHVISNLSDLDSPDVSSSFCRDGRSFLHLGQNGVFSIVKLDDLQNPVIFTPEEGSTVLDAVFCSLDGVSVAVPFNNKTLAGWFRLIMTGKYIQKNIAEFPADIISIDSNFNCTNLLVLTSDGNATVVDSNSGVTISQTQCFIQSKIKPVFSPAGREWLGPIGEKSLAVFNTMTGEGRVLNCDEKLMNAAVFNSYGTEIAAAAEFGKIKIFNAETGEFVKDILLEDETDSVTSLAFSTFGDYLLAGTAKGFVYRWSLAGKVFDATLERYVIYQAPEKEEDIIVKKTQNKKTSEPEETGSKPGESIDFGVGFNSLPDPYTARICFNVDYRRYDLNPFYLVAGELFGIGIPSSDFPYEYSNNGKKLNSPVLYTLQLNAGGGYNYYFSKIDLMLFGELSLCPNIHCLCSNDLNSFVISKPSAGICFDLTSGVLWQSMRLTAGVSYDTNLGVMFKAALSVRQKIKTGGKKK